MLTQVIQTHVKYPIVCVCGVCDDAHTVIHIQMVYADMYMYM